MKAYLLISLLLLLSASQAFAYTSHINALAVLIGTDRGIATGIDLNLTAGNGTVLVGAPNGTVAESTVQSAQAAVIYATKYLGVNSLKYNYNFTFISDQASNISGPSAGVALTLLTISAIKHVPIPQNITATGVISDNGTVSAVGGVTDKIAAAKAINSAFVIVPSAPNTSFDYTLYYLAQQEYNIPVIMVSNASQAISYVFNGTRIKPLSFNSTQDYYASMLNSSSGICPSCVQNDAGFEQLTNSTLNLSQQEIDEINGTLFGSVKSQLQSQLQQYATIRDKGYYYSASDLAFLDYPTSFLFANYKASGADSAAEVIQNVTSYCESLNYTPQMTTSNYEYIVSGQARWAWAMVTLEQTDAIVNASQDSDDLYAALTTASRAYAWCSAVNQLYNISAEVGGNSTVVESTSLQRAALKAISAARAKYGNQLYVNESEYSYNLGDYGAALYSIAYANTFYNDSNSPVFNSTSSVNTTSILSNIQQAANSSNGVWPREFALQSYFYYNEAALSPSRNDSLGYLSAAYSTAKLSMNLDSVNSEIGQGLVPANSSSAISGASSSQIQQIMASIQLIEGVLVVLLIVVFAMFAMLLYHILEHSDRKRRY